jgi:hypothetical protein
MAAATEKLVVTIDVITGSIVRVQRRFGPPPSDPDVPYDPNSQPQGTPIGTLVKYTGSNCVSLNIPGGGSYKVCS